MSFRFVARSAVYGQTQHDPGESMPAARSFNPRAGVGVAVQPNAMPALHQVELLKGEVVRLRKDRSRIVQEANAKLGALVSRVRQLEGMVRTAYSPGVQVAGGQGPGYDVGVPTHALRNPNLYTVDGARGAPPAMPNYSPASSPDDAAGAPGTGARSAEETVRSAEDAIFYGRGDDVFFEGGEND